MRARVRRTQPRTRVAPTLGPPGAPAASPRAVMTGQWTKLARHVVQLTDEPLSEAELVALLKARVQKIPHDYTRNTAAAKGQ